MSRAVPKYRRHPNGQAFIQTARLNGGKRIYLGKYGSVASKKRYAQIIAQLSASQGDAPQPAKGRRDASVVELVAAYLEYAEVYYSKDGKPTREFTEQRISVGYLQLLFGESLAAEFGPRSLMQIQQHLIGKNLCRNVINHRIGRVKNFFRWCCKNELVPQSLYHGLLCVDGLRKGRCAARETKKIGPVPRIVVEATLPWMNPTAAIMAQVQLFCGMRPAEVCVMRPCDIDRSKATWIYSPTEHKNAWRGLVRNIPIPRIAQALLEPFLDRPSDQYIFSPVEAVATMMAVRAAAAGKNRKTKIYPSEIRARALAKIRRQRSERCRQLRDRYDTESYRRTISYAIVKAKRRKVEIPHWHPHQLRHTISTEISQTLGEQAAQRWLGHEHLQATGIYSEKQISELLEIAKQLEARSDGK
jgi:integrase